MSSAALNRYSSSRETVINYATMSCRQPAEGLESTLVDGPKPNQIWSDFKVSSLLVAFIVLVCMAVGILLGLMLGCFLPEDHKLNDSKELLKLAVGMMATLVALIIGLLVSSAKSSYEATATTITQGGAKIITLDRILSHFGADGKEIRDDLYRSIAAAVERIWPSDNTRGTDLPSIEQATGMEEVNDKIRELPARTESQDALKKQALQLSADLLQARWLMIEQSQSTIPTVFLVVLTFWLTALFTGFGLLAPRNVTTISALFICALSMMGAVFLIMELNRPLEGTVKVSVAPFQKALSIIDK